MSTQVRSPNPHRFGTRPSDPPADRFSARRGTYRIINQIDDRPRVVSVLQIVARKDGSRT